jgi:hypothetical protein
MTLLLPSGKTGPVSERVTNGLCPILQPVSTLTALRLVVRSSGVGVAPQNHTEPSNA